VNDDFMRLVMQYKPRVDVAEVQPEDIRERVKSAVSTTRWWQAAHAEHSEYHEQYPGYCPVCIHDKQLA
jgi:hypothetical protein